MNVNAWALEQAFKGRDNARERALGQLWEKNFCLLAALDHKSFTAHQIGRVESAQWFTVTVNGIHPTLLPDTTIWTAPGEHHEIKHKNATGKGSLFRYYGLEKYRLDALLAFRRETQQPVMYTIHDWERAGAVNSNAPMPNRLQDWLTVDVAMLDDYVRAEHLETRQLPTWVNGKEEYRPGYYWPVTLWTPLEWWWDCPF